MRAGPLSDARVIDLLNGHFVCLFTSNDEIPGDADLVKREWAERQKKILEFHKANLGTGSVTVYLLDAEGKPLHRQGVVKATENKENLFKLLSQIVEDLKLAKGKPVVQPAPQASQPSAGPDELLLHLTARKLTPRYSWNEFPSENWIVLQADQWQKLIPAKLEPGVSLSIDRELSARLLTLFFPQTEICTASESKLLSADGPYRHRLERYELKAVVLGKEKELVRCRLEGSVRMLHDFYPNMPKSEGVADSTLLGYLDYDPGTKKIAALRLVTDQAVYAKTPFAVAVRSVPAK